MHVGIEFPNNNSGRNNSTWRCIISTSCATIVGLPDAVASYISYVVEFHYNSKNIHWDFINAKTNHKNCHKNLELAKVLWQRICDRSAHAWKGDGLLNCFLNEEGQSSFWWEHFSLPILNVAWEHIVTFGGVLLPTAGGKQATKSFPTNALKTFESGDHICMVTLRVVGTNNRADPKICKKLLS